MFSQSHEVAGTLRDMAPERFRGESDRRSDVYALGATLYELLTLHPPFEGDDQLRLIRRIETEPPQAPRELDRRIPRDLETIVQKAMAKSPGDRFATAASMRDELRRYVEGRPIHSRPIPFYQQFGRWCKRNPKLAAASIAAAVMTSTLAIVSTLAWVNDRRRLGEISNNLLTIKTSAADARRARNQARLEMGKSLQAEGAALQRSGQVGQRFESLDRLGRAVRVLAEHPEGSAKIPVLRDQAITAMGLTDLRKVWERDIGPMAAVSCDQMLERYAAIEQPSKPGLGGQVVVRSMNDDKELFRIPNFEAVPWWTFFSPDGRYLGDKLGNGAIDIWDLEQKARIFRAPPSAAYSFFADGRQFMFASQEKGLIVWDLVNGREVRHLPLEFRPERIIPDPKGGRIAVNATGPGPHEVRIIDLASGRVLSRWTENAGKGAMAWSADGRLLAATDRDNRTVVWDVERGQVASIFRGHPADKTCYLFAPASHLLATSGWDPMTRFWNAADGEFLLSTPASNPLNFSTDGRRLALYHDGSHLGVYEVSHGDEVLTLNPGLVGNQPKAPAQAQICLASFSPDGRLVAVLTEDAVYLYDPRTGRELAQLDAGRSEGVLFEGHGRSLITYGARGLFRWPIAADPGGAADTLLIGPPALLRESTSDSWYRADWLPDGRTLAIVEKTTHRISLVDTEGSHTARRRAPSLSSPTDSRMTSASVSRDGRWAATGSYNGVGIYVWDLSRRRQERILPAADSHADAITFPAFSPDGAWLISSSHLAGATGYYFWTPGTWERGPFVRASDAAGLAAPVFSPDGRIVAMSVTLEQIRLAEAATGRTIAHLTTLQPIAPAPLAFSADGSRLIAKTDQKTALIWDLGRIRERLKTMGLDWDQPPLPQGASETASAQRPVRLIRVIGKALEPAARRAAELAAVEAQLRDHPVDADALFDRAWLRLLAANVNEAIVDLDRGLRQRPTDADALFLLAEAYRRASNLKDARAALAKYLAQRPDDNEARVLKGRMAYQLDRLREAADDFTKAVDSDPAWSFIRFRRAQIWLRLGRFQDALLDLDELIERDPSNPTFYEFRSQAHERLGHGMQARADLKRALEFPQPGAEDLNTAAWRLATGSLELRDPARAVLLAKKAVEQAPASQLYLNTLGVALYRAGQFDEAVTTLQKSLQAGKGQFDAFDLLFLAMAHHRLGHRAEAKRSFDRAVRWVSAHKNLAPDHAKELAEFKAEADGVLAGRSTEFPDNVFATP